VFDAAPRSGDVRSTGLRCRPPASITSSIWKSLCRCAFVA